MAGVSLDYETEQNVALTITATDSGGLSKSQDFTINVIDVPAATIIGTSNADTIDGTHAPSGQPFSTAEDDTISGMAGNDVIHGLAGNDLIDGGIDNDILYGDAGADTLDGGLGTDTASYATSAAGVTVSLMAGPASGGDAEGDILISIENLTGSNSDDTLEGNAGNNVLAGGLNGAVGDTVSYAHAAAGVTVNLATTSAQNTVGAGSDTLTGFENLTGSEFNDTLTGTAAANVLTWLRMRKEKDATTDVFASGEEQETPVVTDRRELPDSK